MINLLRIFCKDVDFFSYLFHIFSYSLFPDENIFICDGPYFMFAVIGHNQILFRLSVVRNESVHKDRVPVTGVPVDPVKRSDFLAQIIRINATVLN